ncbi:TIGR04255 family protein [Bradyrhizobium sp.]|uniref:TIGR04255 family protein n=1 Tax=Bradyrhizobium sp. TaxID=376 RepID=UPI003C730A19
MAAYVPFAGKNSIVEAVFGLHFAQPLVPQITQKFDALRSEFIADLPSFEKMQMIQLTVGPQQQWGTPGSGGGPTPVVGGFNAAKFRADGKQSRALRGMANFLSVHFLEYERWAETKTDALSFLDRCFRILDLPSVQNPLVGVELRFIDRFTYDGDPAAASASQLLKTTTKFVSPKIFGADNLWHCNSGWFDTLWPEQKCMNQLEVQSILDGSAVVIVSHNAQCNLVAPFKSIQEIKNIPSPRFPLEKVFDAQHVANSMILKDLLSEKILKNIGLIG